MMTLGTNNEPIDVDSMDCTSDSDVQFLTQGRRVHKTVYISGSSTRMQEQNTVIDLTIDDDDHPPSIILPQKRLIKPMKLRDGPSEPAFPRHKPSHHPQPVLTSHTIVSQQHQLAASRSRTTRHDGYSRGPARPYGQTAPSSQSTGLSTAIKAKHNLESLSDEDWDTAHDALEISNEANWSLPLVLHENLDHHSAPSGDELDDATGDALNGFVELLKQHATRQTTSTRIYSPSLFVAGPRAGSVCNQFSRITRWCDTTGTSNARRFGRSATKNTRQWAGLRQVTHAGLMPGAINSISQNGKLVAITSCTSDGLASTDARNIAYNREGTLILLHDDRAIPLNGHCRTREPRERSNRALDEVKYFSVSEAIFVPNRPNFLLSCGEDSRLLVWDCTLVSDGGVPSISDSFSYHQQWVPRGMSFQPNSSMLAVTSSEGEISVHDADKLQDYHILKVTPEQYVRGIQDIDWGKGPSSDKIFATSGLDDYDEHDAGGFCGGFHRGFDVHTGELIFKLDDTRAGEALAVDPAGERLALATILYETDTGFDFEVGLYDIRRNTRAPIKKSPLKGWHPLLSPENSIAVVQPRVNCVSFSPDGIFLAVARSDNRAQLFDTRFFDRILYDFGHEPAPEGTGSDGQYGVYKVEWLEDPRLGLQIVTSGADGCVRLWDVRRGTNSVLAESPNYVSWFNVGDPSRGEKALVMGDGGGNVIIKG